MSRLASFFLYLIHAVYALASLASSLRDYFTREPQILAAERKQIPKHIAVLLASGHDTLPETFEHQLLQNVENVVAWCRVAGIQRLTFYDRQGMLSRLSFELRARLLDATESTAGCTSESEPEYPLTPPLSDDSPSRSRSLSPEQDLALKLQVSTLKVGKHPRRRRNSGRGVLKRRVSHKNSEDGMPPMTLHVISRDSGKPGLAQITNALVREHRRNSTAEGSADFALSVIELEALIEGENALPAPDLMLVHPMTRQKYPKNVLELYGFPPWHISLTELHYTLYPQSWWSLEMFKPTPTYIPLTESDFCRALDEYASAEMRHGK